MKLAESTVEVHSRGVGDRVAYTVSQSPKIMTMLADSLYSDKELAPVRELSTNALDAQIKAGREDVPFDVYLPTRNSLEFKIRDYGCGMDRRQLTEMYTKYGDSDKTDSDDFNGCMGIGSKSPFAYAGSFSTTSFHKGKKYVCVNAKDESGLPHLNFLADGEPTSEPDGLEVSFPVLMNDIHKFETAAETVYRYFPVMPNIKSGSVHISKREYLFENPAEGWRIYKDSTKSVAIMGFVAYPIETSFFNGNKKDSWYANDTTESMLLNLGIELDFRIGEIEMDISRESLQYTKRTIEAIKDKLSQVLAWLKIELSKEYSQCDSLWDARVRYKDLSTDKLRNLQKFVNVQPPTFGGEVVKDKIDVTGIEDKGIEFAMLTKNAPSSRYYRRGYGRRTSTTGIYKDNVRGEFYVPTSMNMKRTKFYINDMKVGAIAASHRILQDQGNNVDTVYLLKFKDNAAKKHFIKVMGFKDESIFNLSSSIPRPVKQKGVTVKENVFSFKATQSYSSKDYWVAATINFNTGGLYVEINNFKMRKDGRDFSIGNVMQMIKVLESFGISVPTLYGVKTQVLDRYKKSDKWEDIFAWMEKKYLAHVVKKGIYDDIQNINELDGFTKPDKYDELAAKLDPTSPLRVFNDKVQELIKLKEKSGKACSQALVFASALGLTGDGTKKYDLRQEDAKILERYPLLGVVSVWEYSRQGNTSKFVDYIKMVDSVKV